MLMEKLNMNSAFFFINDTVNLFPSLEYNSESIPLGNSINFCISANWAPKESKFIFLNYTTIKKIKFPFSFYVKLFLIPKTFLKNKE
jgi:hypothetical protein